MNCFFLIVVMTTSVTTAAAAEPAVQETEAPPTLRVMSFNIRYNNPRDGRNAWPHRKEWVAEVMRTADIVGVQEALPEQIVDLEKLLPAFAWYGVGRTDGKRKGEFVPVFYRKERFAVARKSTFWLSETPEKAGSRGWDASLPRTTTRIRLKDRKTGRTLTVYNTHFDHRGETARRNSARLILKRIAAEAKAEPLVVTGDFNATTRTLPIRLLAGTAEVDKHPGRALLDARRISKAKPTGPDSTWNGFGEIVPGRRIDFIFVTKGIEVRRYSILSESRRGRFPSDHLPVAAELALP